MNASKIEIQLHNILALITNSLALLEDAVVLPDGRVAVNSILANAISFDLEKLGLAVPAIKPGTYSPPMAPPPFNPAQLTPMATAQRDIRFLLDNHKMLERRISNLEDRMPSPLTSSKSKKWTKTAKRKKAVKHERVATSLIRKKEKNA